MADNTTQPMKCEGVTENGKKCGENLPVDSKFCPACATPVPTASFSCSCGNTVQAQHKFCFNCGKPVQPPQELVEEAPSACAACGFTLIKGINFCPKCGARIPDQEEQQDTADSGGETEEDAESPSSSASSSSGGQLTAEHPLTENAENRESAPAGEEGEEASGNRKGKGEKDRKTGTNQQNDGRKTAATEADDSREDTTESRDRGDENGQSKNGDDKTPDTSGGNEQRPQLFSQYADVDYNSQESISNTDRPTTSNIRVEQESKQGSPNTPQEAVGLTTPVPVSDPDAPLRAAEEAEPSANAVPESGDAASKETPSRRSTAKVDDADDTPPGSPDKSEASVAARTRPKAPVSVSVKMTEHPLMETEEVGTPAGEKEEEEPRKEKGKGKKKEAEEAPRKEGKGKGKEEEPRKEGKGKGKEEEPRKEGKGKGKEEEPRKEGKGKGKEEPRKEGKGKEEPRKEGKGKEEPRKEGKGKEEEPRKEGKGKEEPRKEGKGKEEPRKEGKGKEEEPRKEGKGKEEPRKEGKGKEEPRKEGKGKGKEEEPRKEGKGKEEEPRKEGKGKEEEPRKERDEGKKKEEEAEEEPKDEGKKKKEPRKEKDEEKKTEEDEEPEDEGKEEEEPEDEGKEDEEPKDEGKKKDEEPKDEGKKKEDEEPRKEKGKAKKDKSKQKTKGKSKHKSDKTSGSTAGDIRQDTQLQTGEEKGKDDDDDDKNNNSGILEGAVGGLDSLENGKRSNEEMDSTKNTNKSQKSFADVVKSGQKFKAKNDGAASNTLLSAEKNVNVVFHVIMSEKFKMDFDRDLVCIRFAPELLGSFNPKDEMDRYHLKFVRPTEIGPMYEGKVTMTRELRNRGFAYKYVVRRRDSDKPEWEYVLKRALYPSMKQAEVNRYFEIPLRDRSCSDDWHRYDGVAYPEIKEDFWQSVKDFGKNALHKMGVDLVKSSPGKVRERSVAAGKEFLPCVEKIQRILLAEEGESSQKGQGEELLRRVDSVMSGLELQMLDEKLEKCDPALVKTCVRENLVAPLIEALQGVVVEGRQRTVALAMFVWLVGMQYHIHLSAAIINQLCRAMLILPDTKNRTCRDLADLERHFPMKNRGTIAKAVSTLIERSGGENDDSSWWCCLPLLHFLDGTSTPFQLLEPSTTFQENSWWGMLSCYVRTKSFKAAVHQSTRNLMDHVELLKDAFAADAMLCRSVVASLDFDPLLQVLLKAPVSLEASAATLIHHIRLESTFHEDSKQLLSHVLRKMKTMLMQQSPSEDPEQQLKTIQCQTKLLQQLTMAIQQSGTIRRHFEDSVTLDAVHMFFMALDLWADLEGVVCGRKDMDSTEDWKCRAVECVDGACRSFSYSHPLNIDKDKLPNHLKVWWGGGGRVGYVGKLIQTTEHLSHAPLKQLLKEMITKQFEATVDVLPPDDKLEVYLNQMDLVVPAFTVILNRLAFASLEDAFKVTRVQLPGRKQHPPHQPVVLSAGAEVGGTVPPKDIFTFVLLWNPMDNYLQRFGNQQSMESLSEHARQIVEKAMVSIIFTVQALRDGSISVSSLQFLLKHRQRYVAMMVSTGDEQKSIQDLLALRDHELQVYTLASQRINKLLEHCGTLLRTDDFEEVKKRMEDQQKAFQNWCLQDVVQVSLPDSLENLGAYKPLCNPWHLPYFVLAALPHFEHHISSLIFRKMFSRAGEDIGLAHQPSFWRAFKSLWDAATQEWRALCQKMEDGSITLASTERLFRIYRGDEGCYNFTEIESDLCRMSTGFSTSWVDDRIDQFRCYRDIQKHVAAANTLLEMKRAYDIGGNFSDIEKICSLSQNTSQPICDLDQSVLGLCRKLEGVSGRHIKCLEEMVRPRCVEFVQWLRENMKDGLKELNVFVDLAFISAGEEPMSIDRVNCFHAAATGYAPLIFTEFTGGYVELLNQCKLVFDNVTADPKLPEKLSDTVHWLDWFKEVQKSHGSVEKTSLSQVANINARGVFRLSRAAQQGLHLGNILQLRVSEDETGKNPARVYTYDELLDLQSRLMLVAGQAEKGKENVDRFITIMESLIRLGKTYVQLCSDGCVLFLDWSLEFLCDVGRPVCCVSEFASAGKLKGHRSSRHDPLGKRGEDVEEFIGGVAGFLESCHEEWMGYVDQMRQQFPELNTYTVEQLVFLQKQLVTVGSAPLDKQVYPMLSLLKADCYPEDVEQALQEAINPVESLQQRRNNRQHNNSSSRTPSPVAEIPVEAGETRAEFMRVIVDNGFSQSLARQALDAVGVEDVTEGIKWCMEHVEDLDELGEGEEEEEAVEEEGGEGERSVGQQLKTWLTRPQTITQSAIDWLDSMPREEVSGVGSLTAGLRSVWKQFINTVSTSGSDFLSLHHLGVVLGCLAAKDDREFDRCLPPNLKSGMPNLILCPKNEVLNMVTYMYTFPQDDLSLLPQPEEVLLCTPHTTFEQVDIFVRRAFFGCPGKVYSLAFADSLDYDVGEKVEKKIKEYTTAAADDRAYQLVVVCTTENEYRARIVASLEKFRRAPPSLHTPEMVRRYLRSRFAVVHSRDYIPSAATLDPEGMCVRVVRSKQSGVGKTLYKRRLESKLKQMQCAGRKRRWRGRVASITIPLHGRTVATADVAACLLQHTLDPTTTQPRILHLDVAYQVQEGVDHLLYNLLVLGCVMDSHGQVWLRSPMDLYLIEAMPLVDQKDSQKGDTLVHQMFSVLPSLRCWSPLDSLRIMRDDNSVPEYMPHDSLFDVEEYDSQMYKRPYLYLHRLDTEGKLRDQQPADHGRINSKQHCLTTLLKYCGLANPSWSELTHFVSFVNQQLEDYESNVFCSMEASQDLPGFSLFVLRFLIQMSRDFATRSLKMSEESLSALTSEDGEDNDIQQYEMRRTWESSPHPYIFFNPDKNTMTFLGFSVDPYTGNLTDQQTGQVLEQGIMNRQLYQALTFNRVPLNENFDDLPREDRLLRLYRVLGVEDREIFVNHHILDPDHTYELTTDNVKKILAIYMRFRCNIPVIVMGETGCGKTRLVKFLCALQTPQRQKLKTMVLVKVHGGTTGKDVIRKVRQAEALAKKNAALNKDRPIYTVLFFDEANTTEAVGVIKEVMCDGTLDGQPIVLSDSLKMVAACNPYRKHSDDLIERLENAGLGYHVDADKTVDKLGRVPMRRLVYRVQPLPQSMLPLVWDFGQLDSNVEALYIRQMVRSYMSSGQLQGFDRFGVEVLCRLLMESQDFMRGLQDECSFVSLRDVDRALKVISWFLQKSEMSRLLFDTLEDKLDSWYAGASEDEEEWEEEEEEDAEEEKEEPRRYTSDVTKAVILSLGVCYRACLRSKQKYDSHIIKYFNYPLSLSEVEHFADVIDKCQEVFLDNVHLEDNIARNQALKENVFMMVVCIELRVPLFLVGKPGSSKSLAKTIVADAMQGNYANSPLFKALKQAKMASFQCSPLATAEGIVGMFRQCAQVQHGKDQDSFVSVVVLDEVGLAEDSPKMPLKTLHPLLEDGCPGDEEPDVSKKVGFIGISNWALDPAKMNRGILVQRDIPDEEDLVETARGICSTSDERAKLNMKMLIPTLAKAYLTIFKDAKLKREFFGLRDFYSLVKMVYTFAADSKRIPSQRQLVAAIRRNFGGLDTVDPVESFRKHLPACIWDEQPRSDDPDCTASGLIKAALSGVDMGGDSRYLLLLTENYGGLSILSENLLADRKVVPIFGSSFPKDQEYTQVCRNINRIKVCMEMGMTVILLNLENLYESLYDALNQYYAMFGGERYVDLGLGTHRVKCRVHRNFRLIMVAEKQVVYDKFPIPLINRLEKHFLTLNNIMTPRQLAMATALQDWALSFLAHSAPRARPHFKHREGKEESLGDVFVGYHPDTAPAIVVKVWDTLQVDHADVPEEQILEECQRMLLWCATPDAVVRSQDHQWGCVYQQEQQHEYLQQYLHHHLTTHPSNVMAQVTTHSKLLTEQERVELVGSLPVSDITLLSLQAFDTEQQFCQQLRQFFSGGELSKPRLLVVQCDCGDSNQSLVKCAQYCMQDLLPDHSSRHHVLFIIQLPRVAGACFTGFLGGNWHCLHMDDLRLPERCVPALTELQSHTPSQLILASFRRLSITSPPSPDFSTGASPDSYRYTTPDPHRGASPDLHRSVVHDAQRDFSSDFQRNPSTDFRGDASPEFRGSSSGDLGKRVSAESPTGDDDLLDPELVGDESVPRRPETTQEDEMEVDLGHVDIQIEAAPSPVLHTRPVEQHRSYQGFDPQFIKHLFLTSIQAAVAVVRDTEEGALRATHCITLLLHLIEDNEAFFSGLLHLVGRLLEEREKRAFKAERWLLREAARLDSVKKAGTFRRAWMQSLENKVVPVLAGVIAYLDTNRNLDLLLPRSSLSPDHSPPTPGWVVEMWVVVLREACQVTYQQLCSMSKKEELEEFTVHHTGAGAAPIFARLPFSWLLGELVDTAISGAKAIQGEVVQTAGSVVEQSALCRCMDRYVGGSRDLLQHLFQFYIMDLLSFTFAISPVQHQMLCVCVEKGLNQLHQDLLALGVGRGVVVLHLLLEQLRPRLQAIVDLDATRPLAVQALMAGGSGPCAQLLACQTEVTEDVAMLRLVVEELQPRPNQFAEEHGCNSWVSSYTTVAPAIIRVLKETEAVLTERGVEEGEGSSPVNVLPYGEQCRQQLQAIRCLWNRMTTVKLLFDYIRPLHQGPAKLRKALGHIKYQLLWTLLEEDADLKKKKTLKEVDKFLKHINSFVLRGLLGRLGKCSFCDKKFESAPVELPCKHLLCNSCYRDCDHGNKKEVKCPECKLPVPADFDPFGECQDREAMEQLGRYQRQVSGFLMALVSQLCFAGKQPPEPDALRHIFGYITHRSKGKTLLQTKHMTVHDDLVDPTPVLRSFLLRLLLKHSEREVQGYLDKFLKNCQQLVDQQTQVTSPHSPPSTLSTLLEFSLLVVHCQEDLLHEQFSLKGEDACGISQHLQSLTNQLQLLRDNIGIQDTQHPALSALFQVGFLRYAMSVYARVLYSKLVVGQGTVAVLEKDLEDLTRVLLFICMRIGSKWPRMFLIKQLCREYGLQAYTTLTTLATQQHLLHWIIFSDKKNKVEEVADRYLVCSTHYKDLRDALALHKLSNDWQAVQQALEASCLCSLCYV
ncbi:hypothetical protein ACOMHN_065913 [Nucella lapillus]